MDIKKEVLNLIYKITKSEYLAKIDVIEEEDFYTLKLYMNQNESPMVFGKAGSKEKFLIFLEQEFKSRNLESIMYTQTFREPDMSGNIYLTLDK